MRAEISRLAGIVRTFINIQLSLEIFPPLAKGTFFQKENNRLKRRCEEKEEKLNCEEGRTETLVRQKQSKLFRETFLYLRYKSELFPLKFRIPQFIRIK